MKIFITTKVLMYSALFGVLIAVAGIVLGYRIFPMMVANKIWENTVLQENTPQWDRFMKLPFPFQVKVYFFDVQNTDDILQGAKPIVREKGPYVYKLFRWKSDVTWKEDEISYFDWMKFEFDKNASGSLSDEDNITILNSPYNALLLAVEELSPSALESLNDALPNVFNNRNIFITAKVKEHLFVGVTICGQTANEDDFLTKMICDQIKAKAKVSKGMSIVNNSIVYSYLNFKNDTHLGRFTIKSGLKGKEEVSNLIKFNNASRVNVWVDEESECNRVNGTTTFRPYVTPEMEFYAFSEDICRRLKMVFKGTDSLNGITGYKYVIANNSFESNAENSCYCVNRSRTLDGGFGCLGDGLLDVTTCVGAPVLLSFPHVLYGDKKYVESVDGLHPDEHLHQSFITLEPTSGTPLQVAKRVQFNMFLRAIEDISSLENVTNALMPILWLEESMTLDEGYLQMIKETLLDKLKILDIVKWALMVLGGTAVIVSVGLMMYKC